ncbi:uncharacterized protein LOC120720578 [Tachysurus ichikawai]
MEQHPDVVPEVVREAFSFNCRRSVALIQMMQNGDQAEKEGIVKVGRINIIVAAGQTTTVSCNVRTGQLAAKQEVLFEPEDIPQWPEGLNVARMVVSLQKGNLTKVQIPVTNSSNRDITLTPRTVLGRVQQVRAIYPADTQPVVVTSDWNVSSGDGMARVAVTGSREGTGVHCVVNTVQDVNKELWDPLVSIDHLTPEHAERRM